MAILNLWINSREMNLTADNCSTLLQAIATTAKIPVNFPFRRKRKAGNTMFNTRPLKIAGETIPKKYWPKLTAACQQVIDGSDARFQVGWRMVSAITTRRPSYQFPLAKAAT